jgi:mono/diheme cytochrome c family protein
MSPMHEPAGHATAHGRGWMLILLALGMASMLGACRGQTSTEPPIVPVRNMYDQQRYDPQSESAFFEDKRTMRPRIEGTVAREEILDPQVATGLSAGGDGYVLTLPDAAVQHFGGMEALLARGKDRYGIYCVPCHDGTGGGQGMVVRRGMLAPPSFHSDRIRHLPDGQLFATISNGIRNMPAYSAQVPVQDRWAIVGYMRALQLSQLPDHPTQEPAAVPAGAVEQGGTDSQGVDQ